MPASDSTGGFFEYQPSQEDLFRGVILFGLNSASYKFALGKSILELAARGEEQVSLTELAVPFAKHICEHLEVEDKQGTSESSEFLEQCRAFNKSEINEGRLIEETESRGFVNVIDAFHRVGSTDIPTRFFLDERKSRTKGIILTPEIHEIAIKSGDELIAEVESRWRLVETAWSLNIDSSLILFDENESVLLSGDRRKNITSARSALNGYQKGKCFYCFRKIEIISGTPGLADVDHLFPHALQRMKLLENIDGVWNLVLACRDCNRGPKGKFDFIPHKKYLERLERRNNYLIASHHPLRETLIKQTGETEKNRHQFLQNYLDVARKYQPAVWQTEELEDPTF
ncbi:hypothetical protein OAK27_01950 [Acidimicrobiaceae bacterium]|nr:hypothetical protein [Acidimicrobiaceae bacterium]|tara:strand:- start:552 stop:1580 length:1029 start_codon:yes stop_codon:yes gene_type:complete